MQVRAEDMRWVCRKRVDLYDSENEIWIGGRIHLPACTGSPQAALHHLR